MDDYDLMRDPPGVAPPSVLTRLMEATWPAEAAAFLAMSPLLRRIGRGDRHPVLILPGFTASDRSTRELRAILRANGYLAHGWLLGRNIGPSQRIVEGLRERIIELSQRHDRPLTLIGWSLGGIFARTMAREHPELVRQVITLVSPFRMTAADRSSVQRMYDSFSYLHDSNLDLLGESEHERPRLTVPATSIYTRTDGVAAWQTCLDVVGPISENIEIYGSHIGVGVNPAAIYAILDRLRQPEDDWRPFQPPFSLRLLYPHPATWRETRTDGNAA